MLINVLEQLAQSLRYLALIVNRTPLAKVFTAERLLRILLVL
jgi:hypothetical protein